MSTDIVYSLIAEDGITALFDRLTSATESLIGGSLKLAAQFEQTQIGFTSMLNGNKQAADEMLGKLQALANLTPFTFEGEQSAARQLEAMGQAADKVLPELKDIDTAVAAIGGGDQQVDRVAAALSKMDAAGKTSAVYLNELTRDGIPAWRMLSEAMGLSVEQVRTLSEQGAIASSVFDNAFHDYTVKHFNDALGAQSQTFNGLLSTAGDFGQQLERAFGNPIIAELEPKLRGLLQAIQDPAVIAAITAWGQEFGKFLGQVVEVSAEIARWAGIPLPDLNAPIADANAALAQFNGSWASTAPLVATTKDQVKGLRDEIAQARDATAAQDAIWSAQTAHIRDAQAAWDAAQSERIAGVRAEQTASDAASQSRLDGLRAQVSALQEAYTLEDQRIALTRDTTQLGVDQAEAVNRFSASGAAARARVITDQAKIEDDQRKAARTGTLDALQDQISAEEAKKRQQDATFQSRLTALETEKRVTDANFASQLRGIEDTKRAYDAAAAAAVRTQEAAIRDIEGKATASTAAIVADRKQGDDISTRYGIASATTATDEYRAMYDSTFQHIHDGAGITGGSPPNSPLFEKIFGTPGQQQQAGSDLAANLVAGIGTGLHEWIGGKGSPVMNVIMGGTSPADAVKNWLNQVTGVGALGSDLEKSMFPGFGGVIPVGPMLKGQGAQAWNNENSMITKWLNDLSDSLGLNGPKAVAPPPAPGQPGYIGPVRPGGGRDSGAADGPTTVNNAAPIYSGGYRGAFPAGMTQTNHFHISGFIGNESQLTGALSKALADHLYGSP